jgi:hypothetical protein
MKNYKLKGLCIKPYNDTQKGNILIEVGEAVIEERGRYEFLQSKSFVTEGTPVEDKPKKEDKMKSIKED